MSGSKDSGKASKMETLLLKRKLDSTKSTSNWEVERQPTASRSRSAADPTGDPDSNPHHGASTSAKPQGRDQGGASLLKHTARRSGSQSGELSDSEGSPGRKASTPRHASKSRPRSSQRSLSDTDEDDVFSGMSPKKRSSSTKSAESMGVWQHITKLGGKRKRCTVVDEKTGTTCNKILTCSTTNLAYHLAHSHGIIVPIRHRPENSKKTISTGLRKDLNEKLVKMVVKDFRSFRSCQSRAFLNFIGACRPGYRPLNRLQISKTILEEYEKTKVKIIALIKKAGSKIAVAPDYWTAPNGIGILGVMAHFFDQARKLRIDIPLGFGEVKPPHTAGRTHDELQKLFKSFDIEDKLSAMVSDNATNLDGAYELLKQKNPDLIRVRCAAHVANIVCQAGLGKIDATIAKVRRIAKSLRYTKGFEQYAEIQKNINDKMPARKIKIDVKTRWNSTFDMLNDSIPFKTAINAYVDKNTKLAEYKLHDFEWEEVHRFVKFLEPFKELTLELFSKDRNTLSSVLPLMDNLRSHLSRHTDDTHIEIEEAAKVMLDKLNQYWEKVNTAEIQSATVLDPRIKSDLIDADQEGDIVSFIHQKIRSRLSAEAAPRADSGKKVSALERILAEKRNKSSTPSSSAESIDGASVERYLQEGTVPMELDPAGWWKKNSSQFNELTSVAFDMLAIPATSVATEQLNSQGRLLIAYTRSRLSARVIQDCICLKYWYKVLYPEDEAEHSDSEDEEDDDSYDPLQTDSEEEDDEYAEALLNISQNPDYQT